MKAVDAMKPAFLRTFSIRTLLVVVTLVAIGLGFAAENWRQQRVVDDVLQAIDADGGLHSAVGYDDGGVFLWLWGGDVLSEATARKIVDARRIAWIRIEDRESPQVQALLESMFLADGTPQKFRGHTWYRKNVSKRPYTQADVWKYGQGYKQKPQLAFVPDPFGQPYEWPVFDLVFWPYKTQVVFGVAAIVVGVIGWLFSRRRINKKRTLR